MKKFLIGTAALAIAVSAYAENEITVSVDGKNVEFDQPPVIDNDRTLVPMRAIFEALGAEVDWDGETRTVTSKRNDIEISLTIDTDLMRVGDRDVTLDVPAKIISDRTMVPVRAISEAMECNVDWDGETRSVIITTTDLASEMPVGDEKADSTAAPSEAPEPTSAPTEAPSAAPAMADIADDENIFDTAWLIGKKEIDAATGQEKDNESVCMTDYVPVNAEKSYYAGYYDPNEMKYKTGYCYNYAFYDADKKYISGKAEDMAKMVTAPENAAYVRFTVKLSPASKRAPLYLTFMQTESAPAEFSKSEAVAALAETDKFEGKRIYIVGDMQVPNIGVWLGDVERRLGPELIAIKGHNYMTFPTMYDWTPSFSKESTLNSFPKDMDYFIIQSGLYEWTESRDIGSDVSSSGGIYDFIEYSKQKWPNTKLVFLTIPPAAYAVDGFTDVGKYNKLGMGTVDYSNLIIEACEKENIDVIDISDLWTYSELNRYMKADNLNFLYPNEEGGELIAQRVYERMTEIAGE